MKIKVPNTRIYLMFLTRISNYMCIQTAAHILVIVLLKETSTKPHC